MNASRCREPVQAGRFYPADPEELRQTIQGKMGLAEPMNFSRPVCGLVSPHAGYAFSGGAAAWAYRQVQDSSAYKNVVVLAPSHYTRPAGGSIFDGEFYRTPFGMIPMNMKVVQELRGSSDLFIYDKSTHDKEHSLETQLPFLQVSLGEFSLIPVVVSGAPSRKWEQVADALGEALERAELRLGRDTLVVASSDLYHGTSEGDCERNDARVAQEIETFDPEEFAAKSSRRDLMACGAGPIAIMMRLCRQAGAEEMKVIFRTNSYKEYPVNPDYTVGYLAAAAW